MDDIIIVRYDHFGVTNLEDYLQQNFEIKDFGSFKYFIGLEILLNTTWYYFSHAKYAFNLLSHASLPNNMIPH